MMKNLAGRFSLAESAPCFMAKYTGSPLTFCDVSEVKEHLMHFLLKRIRKATVPVLYPAASPERSESIKRCPISRFLIDEVMCRWCFGGVPQFNENWR